MLYSGADAAVRVEEGDGIGIVLADSIHNTDYSTACNDSGLRRNPVFGAFPDYEIVVLFVDAVLQDLGRDELVSPRQTGCKCRRISGCVIPDFILKSGKYLCKTEYLFCKPVILLPERRVSLDGLRQSPDIAQEAVSRLGYEEVLESVPVSQHTKCGNLQ
mgnify:CR=1 FL=1